MDFITRLGDYSSQNWFQTFQGTLEEEGCHTESLTIAVMLSELQWAEMFSFERISFEKAILPSELLMK